MAGPVGLYGDDFPFFDFKVLLQEKGLVPFCRALLDSKLGEKLLAFDLSFYRDMLQVFEMLLLWEKSEGFSFEGLKRHLAYLKDLEADEGGRRRMETDENAVQVMTMHASKGLEFDIVFAFGLAIRTQKSEEPEEELDELNAEKLRQLYVAMTRAKRRLYVPLPYWEKEARPGAHSPVELFCNEIGAGEPLLSSLSQHESLTVETLVPISEPSHFPKQTPQTLSMDQRPRAAFAPRWLLSFTSLTQTKDKEFVQGELEEGVTLHTMPRGTETGIAIHRIFERLFTAKTALWRNDSAVASLVADELRSTSLSPWENVVLQMVSQTLSLPLQSDGEFFTLSELNPDQCQAEMSFLFAKEPHFVKGFIDLVFSHRGKYYFVDWKTNWLGVNDGAYGSEALEKAIQDGEYALQAALYAEALQRHLKQPIERAFYLFVRGNAVYSISPNLNLIQECHATPFPE
jgi:exodeoxyribonuclease V beta subunit